MHCPFLVLLSKLYLRFTLCLLSPRVPSEKRQIRGKLSWALALPLAVSYKLKTLSGFQWCPLTTSPPSEINITLRQEVAGCVFFCSVHLSPWDRGEKRKQWAPSAFFLSNATNTHTDMHSCTHLYALSHHFVTHLLCMALLPNLPSLSSVEESGMALREDAARPVGTLRRTEVEAGVSGTQFVPWLWAHGLVTEPFTFSAPFDLWQAGDGT